MHMTRRTRRLHAGFLWLFAAAALTGCGGATTTVSRDFQVEANRVCRNAEAQLNQIQSTHPQTADQAEKQAAALVDVSQQALDDLHQIEPPAALKAGYERYLSSREQALGFIEDARDAAGDNDALGYDRAKRRLSVQQPLRRQLALRIGLRDCSRPVPSS